MERTRRTRERNTLIMAVLAFALIGLVLFFSTWQAIRQQREVEERHLEISTRAVILTVENSLRRGPVHRGGGNLDPHTDELFRDLESDGDVLFAGLLSSSVQGEEGEARLLTPSSTEPVSLPGTMTAELFAEGEWHGTLPVGDRTAYVYGKRLSLMRGRMMHRHMVTPGPPLFLVVGADREKVLGPYAGYRQSIVLQAIYMLAAAVFAWGLGLSFLARRKEARRAAALEQSLAEAEKLAAIGALAAGVAHEVRNPLSSLRGFAQYFVKKLAGRQPEEEYARTMVREADRLNRVITDLLFFARPGQLAPRTVSLPALAREISLLLRFDLENRKITIHTNFPAPELWADEDLLKQTLLNLLLNSLDALKEQPPPPSPGEFPPLSLSSWRERGGVCVEVRDSGIGMTEEQRERAFEAFFTAKKHGTGLGLALVQRAMSDHGGSARILSEPGKGCAVRLFFPDKEPV